jgi:hypothetical protein
MLFLSAYWTIHRPLLHPLGAEKCRGRDGSLNFQSRRFGLRGNRSGYRAGPGPTTSNSESEARGGTGGRPIPGPHPAWESCRHPPRVSPQRLMLSEPRFKWRERWGDPPGGQEGPGGPAARPVDPPPGSYLEAGLSSHTPCRRLSRPSWHCSLGRMAVLT